MSSPHSQLKGRRAQQSPFKVSDDNIVFLLNSNKRGDQKEEMHKFLALPIEEKMTHVARKMTKLKNELVGELKQENERKKILNQIKSKAILPKQTSSRHELKIASLKGEHVTKKSKQDLILMERQKAVLELSLITKRSEMMKMDKIIAKEERKLKQLENTIERDNQKFEEFLKDNERKSVEARTLFEQEDKSKQEKNIEIKKLAAETRAIKSEISKFEELLTDYKIYKEFLFKISPSEWQHEQENKTLKAEVVSEEDGQDDQNKKPWEMATRNSLESKLSSSEKELSSIREIRSSVQSDTLEKNSNVNVDSSGDEAELYFTDPQQLMYLMTELTEQNLSLIQNSVRVEEGLGELRRSITTTETKIEEEEKHIILLINEMKQKIDREKERGLELYEQKVQHHKSLTKNNQDVMLDALSEKVGEVYCSCVDDRITNLSTLEKVAKIENLLSSLLQSLESIPEEKLQKIKKIKDSEKRSRQREEKQREQREKQKERIRKYLERSLAVSKKVSGRKLMPRCLPVSQRVKVSDEDNTPAEDDFHEYLFGSDDME